MGSLDTLTFACPDAAFLIDFLRGPDNTRRTYLELKSQRHRFATTAVVAFKLF